MKLKVFLVSSLIHNSVLFYYCGFIFVLNYHTTFSQNTNSSQSVYDDCGNKQSCHECIRVRNCGWCAKEDYGDKRCLSSNLWSNKTCPEEYFYYPKNEYRELQAKKLSYGVKKVDESSSSSSEKTFDYKDYEIVQLTPQKSELKLRLNVEQRIKFVYQQEANYPLDLYYLMDLSSSMRQRKDNLAKLGNKLAKEMRALTLNLTLGFGSFIDKNVLPYVDPQQIKKGTCRGCVKPYGFINVMPLSNDTESFSKKVKEASVSTNVDSPEGGFDAIMQALVCNEQIGWRAMARRIIIFSTDAAYHIAGDGKLGGIVKPNDGKCHLDQDGRYSMSTEQDYPSIGQLNAIIRKSNFILIFAVSKSVTEIYKPLTDIFPGSSYGLLSSNSSDIVDVIKKEYQKLNSKIEMTHNANEFFKISFHSKCLKPDGPLNNVGKCEDIKVGSTVEFEAHIELIKCPDNSKDWNQVFKIYPVGINEKLTINVTMLCDCDCEHPGNKNYEKSSPKCSSNGTYSCGKCFCNKSRYGQKCECDKKGIETGFGDKFDKSCSRSNTSTVCSGRGDCICGECVCHPGNEPGQIFSGPFCECDNLSCDLHQGKVCGGPDHGTCDCGKCKCEPGWAGDNCDCLDSIDYCKSKGRTEICSGHGECKCGKCICDVDEKGTTYSGRYCEICTTCTTKCNELRNCVMCRAYKKYNIYRSEQNCIANCSWFDLELRDAVQFDPSVHEKGCYEEDEQYCNVEYFYKYDENGKIAIEALKEPNCPLLLQLDIKGIVTSVILTVVLIGVVFLVAWKIVTSIHDKREYIKFEKEREKAKWHDAQNPLYKPSVSNFQNPMYKARNSKIE